MFIETETTPNPATIKFIPHETLIPAGETADFRSGDDLKSSPLARRLFAVDGVEGVFIATDFVSVTKQEPYDWAVLKPEILAALMDHSLSGEGAVIVQKKAASSNGFETEIEMQIKELIETRVRPAVAADGGDIIFSSFEDGVVYLEMQGACAGCPSSTATLKDGIENMLKHYIPEVTEVRAA